MTDARCGVKCAVVIPRKTRRQPRVAGIDAAAGSMRRAIATPLIGDKVGMSAHHAFEADHHAVEDGVSTGFPGGDGLADG